MRTPEEEFRHILRSERARMIGSQRLARLLCRFGLHQWQPYGSTAFCWNCQRRRDAA